MKDSITKQLGSFTARYSWLGSSAIKNMRLLLLILFAGLSGYLVLRIDTLVNGEVLPTADETSSVSKKLDADVLSAFDELYIHDVSLDSSFEDNRVNPF
jgi:hypothetical protein